MRLLTDRIEFADVTVFNRTADAGPERTDSARKIIRSLNGDAKIIETNQSDVPADDIFDTKLFDFDKAHKHPLRAREHCGFADRVPETKENGVSSHVYRTRRPFVPEKPMPLWMETCQVLSGQKVISAGHAARVGGRFLTGGCAVQHNTNWNMVGDRSARTLA